VIEPQNGQPTTLLIGGVYYTPRSPLIVSATNDARTEFRGGVVADTLTIAESASAINLILGVTIETGDRNMVITSTAAGAEGARSVTSTAIVRVSSSTGTPLTVLSRRSNAPDAT